MEEDVKSCEINRPTTLAMSTCEERSALSGFGNPLCTPRGEENTSPGPTGVSPESQELSPRSQERLRQLKIDLSQGKAKLEYDKNNKVHVNYCDDKSGQFKMKDIGKVLETDQENKEEVLNRVMQVIEFMKSQNAPQGVALNSAKTKPQYGYYEKGQHYTMNMDQILGGGVHGKVVMVYDEKTEEKSAFKKVMLLDFREEEIRAWVAMEDNPHFPELYMLKVEGDKVLLFMEPLQPKITLTEVIDQYFSQLQQQGPAAQWSFSIFVVKGLLEAIQALHEKGYTHNDLHTGNILLEDTKSSMEAKVTDDLWNILRTFIALCAGYTFESTYEMTKHWRDALHYVDESFRKEFEEIVAFCIDAALNFATELPAGKLLNKLNEAGDIAEDLKDCMSVLKGIFFSDGFMPIHPDQTDKTTAEPQAVFGVNDTLSKEVHMNLTEEQKIAIEKLFKQKGWSSPIKCEESSVLERNFNKMDLLETDGIEDTQCDSLDTTDGHSVDLTDHKAGNSMDQKPAYRSLRMTYLMGRLHELELNLSH
ncbi:uncharacterized protein LOC106176376 isoform X2 [Lingula anatina]|uniref:Uncharacterized protein LOC106176376 isoform X2 n=1 Tax=Lingula anatina TaxID=7574 RepID=A0A1S3JVV3_LINAN|nr:uncharacterized protein LOC106176376 isoform X2 [Lingula anatina]|eukprot:XP_013414191.1 uncharacterized protein LOC106176376 isoform X2 [Lingula anatina]